MHMMAAEGTNCGFGRLVHTARGAAVLPSPYKNSEKSRY
jgi:hypothetical protein